MNIVDMFILGILLFGSGVLLFSSAFLGNVVLQEFKNNTMVANVTEATGAISGAQAAFSRFDTIFAALFIGFALFTWVGAYFVGGNPVFTWIYVVIMALVMIITPVLAIS